MKLTSNKFLKEKEKGDTIMKNRIFYLFVSATVVLTLFSCIGKDVAVIENNNETTEIVEEVVEEVKTETTEEDKEIEEKEDASEITDEKTEVIDETEDTDTVEETSEDISSDEDILTVEIEKDEPETKPEEASEEEVKEEPKEEVKEEKKEEKKEEVKIPDSFDANYYANNNPDVVAAFGNSPEALYKHYLNYGKKEGRPQNANEASQKAQTAQQPQTQQAQGQTPSQLVSASGQVFDFVILDDTTPHAESTTYEVVCDAGMLNLINSYRAECGASALSWNAGAEQIAKDRIKAIAQGGVLSHDAAGGPPAGFVGENLFQASGSGLSSEEIFNGYKNSPGHATNMKSTSATSCVIATCYVYYDRGDGFKASAGQWNIQIFY